MPSTEILVKKCREKSDEVVGAIGLDINHELNDKEFCDELYDFIRANIAEMKKFDSYPTSVHDWYYNYITLRAAGDRLLRA